MVWQRINLEAKSIINRYPVNSLYYNNTFTYLFLNDGICYDVFYREYKNWLLIKYYCYEDKRYYYLIPRGTGKKEDLLEALSNEGNKIIIKCADNKWKRILDDETIICEKVEEEFDYIYSRDDLMNFDKGKLKKKKRRLQKLISIHPNLKCIPINRSHKEDLLLFFENWAKNKVKSESIIEEFRMIEKLLSFYPELDCEGIVVKNDNDETIGFTIGEIYNQNVLVIYFEKANRKLTGAYAYVCNQFAKSNKFSKIKYVNRQDDMGDKNLRQSKRSYMPLFLYKKYDLTLK